MFRILGLVALGLAALTVAGLALSRLEAAPPRRNPSDDDDRLRDLDARLAAGGRVVLDTEGGFRVVD